MRLNDVQMLIHVRRTADLKVGTAKKLGHDEGLALVERLAAGFAERF